MKYQDLIASKQKKADSVGFDPVDLPSPLRDYQAAIVRWACKKGRAALFEDCGLGKTIQQLAWAEQVAKHTGMPVIILAPLAVTKQTEAEALRFGIEARQVDKPDGIDRGIVITNYEKLHLFDDIKFGGVVLDESSIIKASDGRMRHRIIDRFASTPYKLACTATPSPNDHTELGNHSEFLGIMSRVEMLASFFVHDLANTQDWRLKGHAEADFWKWVASWAVMIRRPSDIGFSDEGFNLPPLNIETIMIDAGEAMSIDTLFPMPAKGLSEQRNARKATIEDRCSAAASIANADDQWLVWCELNDEGNALASAINGAVEVAGSHDDETKSSRMIGFSDGEHRALVTKPKIGGFGMNWQRCSNMLFVGLSHSYEQFYQAVRRCWRYGQKNPVRVVIISTIHDQDVIANIQEKQRKADEMADGMIAHMKETMQGEINGTSRMSDDYVTAEASGDTWRAMLRDCVDGVGSLESDSVGYSIFSPPFASLYTYSNSPRDMGNCGTHAEFYEHFKYLVDQLFRVLVPGRLVSFHCMNLPTSKERDGFIGITDFRGELIRMFQAAGFIYHSEVTIWKDPVQAMQRTKALGLLHKTIRKDSSMSRQGIPDYLVTMRKPGQNPVPITHGDDLPVDLWQQYASPVWMDIVAGDTLQHRSARDEKDEKHICPLQLEVIRRAMHLWSKEGDLVLSPFMGIGSEGYIALKMGRRFIGTELKRSYWEQACNNLRGVELERTSQASIFEVAP